MTTTDKVIKPVIEGEAEHSHFFVSTCDFLVVNRSLVVALDKMRHLYRWETDKTKENVLMNVFLVPVPSDAQYDISAFAPKVEGAQLIFKGKLFPLILLGA